MKTLEIIVYSPALDMIIFMSGEELEDSQGLYDILMTREDGRRESTIQSIYSTVRQIRLANGEILQKIKYYE